MPRHAWGWAVAGFLTAAPTQALDFPEQSEVAGVVDAAHVRAIFTPGGDIAGQMIDAVNKSRRQVLVQAFSFTHGGIANSLIDAYRRGVEVKVIADRAQTEKMDLGQIPALARVGVPVWLDGDHQSAHNKVMVIDVGTPAAVVVTGSFNFTRAAQHKNAENVIFISGNDALAQAYALNWQTHLGHSRPLVIH